MSSGASKLRELRRGIPPHKRIHIGGEGEDGFDAMVVILSADKCLEIEEQTQSYCKSKESSSNENVKTQFYNALLVSNCLRDVNDLNSCLASDVADVLANMDLEDINRVVNAYGELMMNKAPKLELLTEEQFEDLKKVLEVTPLSGLSTVSLVHLANFHRTLLSEK